MFFLYIHEVVAVNGTTYTQSPFQVLLLPSPETSSNLSEEQVGFSLCRGSVKKAVEGLLVLKVPQAVVGLNVLHVFSCKYSVAVLI